MKHQLLFIAALATAVASAPALARMAIDGHSFNHETSELKAVLASDLHDTSFDRVTNAMWHPVTDHTVNRYESQLHHDLTMRTAFLKADPNGF